MAHNIFPGASRGSSMRGCHNPAEPT